jgi:hypothetical protein
MKHKKSIFTIALLSFLCGASTVFAGQLGDFTYTESDGAITITGYNCADGDAVIPSIIDEKPVIRIGPEAFFNCAGMTSVTIPCSVTTIDQRAFYGCGGLTSVAIPDSVRSIGHHAFYGCTGLKSSPVRVPHSLVIVKRFD